MEVSSLQHRLTEDERRTFQETGLLMVENALSPEQVTKATAILKEYNDARTPLMSYMMTQRQAQAEINADSQKKSAALTAKFNADFKAILNADQAKIFDSVQAARAARMGGRGPGAI